MYEPSNLKAHFADYVVLECLDFDSFPIAVSTDDLPECLVFKKKLSKTRINVVAIKCLTSTLAKSHKI